MNAKQYPAGIPDCGADALRFSLCARNIKSRTISFDVDDCRTSKYFCNKIWQASKYVLLMTKTDDKSEVIQRQEQHKENGNLCTLDRWILSRLSWMVETVNDALAERNFHKAVAAIRQFLHYEFCDLYVEGTKYGFKTGTVAIIVGHSDTLARCLEVLLRVLAPIMPYLSDELYTRLAKKKLQRFKLVTSVLETSYPMSHEFDHLKDVALEQRMHEIENIIHVIRSCMTNVSRKTDPKVTILLNNECDYNFYQENINLIKGVSRIKNVCIYLKGLMKNDNFNETTRDFNTDSNNVHTTQYLHTNNCSLLIAVTNVSMLEQVKQNIARKKESEKRKSEGIKHLFSYGTKN